MFSPKPEYMALKLLKRRTAFNQYIVYIPSDMLCKTHTLESNLKKKCTLSLIIIHFVTGQGFHNRCKIQQNKSQHRQLLWVVNNRTLQIVG